MAPLTWREAFWERNYSNQSIYKGARHCRPGLLLRKPFKSVNLHRGSPHSARLPGRKDDQISQSTMRTFTLGQACRGGNLLNLSIYNKARHGRQSFLRGSFAVNHSLGRLAGRKNDQIHQSTARLPIVGHSFRSKPFPNQSICKEACHWQPSSLREKAFKSVNLQ